MTSLSSALLNENTVLYVCLIVGVFGVLALAGVLWFGIVLYRGRLKRGEPASEDAWLRIIDRGLNPPAGAGRPNLRNLFEGYSEHLERRNEFWTGYGQIIIAGLIIVLLTILLLTRSISAEAGLPVLSGVSGFALAKTVSGSRGGSTNEPDQKG